MTKRIIKFSNFFIPAVIISTVVIVAGLIGLGFAGFNLGVDFQAGINQTVQLAYPAAQITYAGKGNAELKLSETALTLVVSGAQVEKKTVIFDYKTYPTIGAVTKALGAEPGITATLGQGAETLQSSLLVPTYQGNSLLSLDPITMHRAPASASENFATTEKVRAAVKSLGQVSVQIINPESLQRYLIRVQEKGSNDPKFAENVRAKITSGLEAEFGKDRVVGMETQVVGAQYSEALSRKVAWLVLATLAGILLYCALRFRLDYAIGAVLSVLHDALIMVAFIVFTRMEFNTSTIAAILTVLGYSINDTIVQYDRVREERRLTPNDSFKDVLDRALTITLGRTIITTLTTLLTVWAIFFFTKGSMKDFALALMVGMTSGVYSTIYVASAFVYWWDNLRTKKQRKFQGRPAAPAAKGAVTKAELGTDGNA